MTLTEYMNQDDPIRNPVVILTKDEFVEHHSIWNGSEHLSFIEIPSRHKKYGIDGNYIQIDVSRELYTHCENGNPKRLSCFRLP